MNHNLASADVLVEKYKDLLESTASAPITDPYRKRMTAVMLENQAHALAEERSQGFNPLNEAAPAGANTSSMSTWDPILMALVRRSAPNLIGYDVCGVQPMTGPTGIAFAMKARYGAGSTASKEALFNEAETNFSGDSVGAGAHDSDNVTGLDQADDGDSDLTIDDSDLTDITGVPMSTADAEALGDGVGRPIAEMGFTIEKATVTAKSRALKAEYTTELAQDLKAIHGLEAETELANILSTEILAEMNREIIRTLNSQAKLAATTDNTAVNGIFNLSTDADGRWSVEKFKGLMLQITRESHVIAKETRRGRGNFIICSADVASALEAAGILDYNPALQTNLNVDDTGNTFAGVIGGRTKVFVDPYAVADYVNVGYKGASPYDAGVFYCPYVPLTMMRAVEENSFQPKIGFKTRYGMVSNPFVGSTPANGLATARSNQYYRIFRVEGILQ
jgi:hypothetical protein